MLLARLRDMLNEMTDEELHTRLYVWDYRTQEHYPVTDASPFDLDKPVSVTNPFAVDL